MIFKHITPIQLRFKDGDVMGHVNNANHFTYFELARINYFRDVVGKDIDWKQDGIILAKMSVDYKQPLLIHEKVQAYTRCSRLGNKSFDLEYLLVSINHGKETIIATGLSVLVCFNYKKNESVLMPEDWKKKFSEYESLL